MIPSARRATTLVELIAAMVIVGIAVPPILAMVSASLQRGRESIERRRAVLLAESVMETVLADAYAGSESIDITDAGYSAGVEGRLGPAADFYAELGYEWDIGIEGPVDGAGVATGTGADLFHRVTTTVRYRPARAADRAEYALSLLVTTFPPADEPGSGVVRGPHPLGWPVIFDFDGVEGEAEDAGRWRPADDGVSIYCPWANYPLTFEAPIRPPKVIWHVGITAKNFSADGLPPGYTEFRVEVLVDGDSIGEVRIPASDTEWSTVWVDIGEHHRTVDLTLRWKNDAYRAGDYDANIQIGAVRFAQGPRKEKK